jgi:hypothetical protein
MLLLHFSSFPSHPYLFPLFSPFPDFTFIFMFLISFFNSSSLVKTLKCYLYIVCNWFFFHVQKGKRCFCQLASKYGLTFILHWTLTQLYMAGVLTRGKL